MSHGLPADGATTRRYKIYHLAEYCAMFPDGVTKVQLLRLGLSFGNTGGKILNVFSKDLDFTKF